MTIFDEPSRRPLPQPGLEDARHAGTKGLIALIPVVGAPGAELVGLLASPVARRRDEWLEDLERRLRELEARTESFRFDDLASNEQFVSAALQATSVALRTSANEKRDALRNAVLNVAAGSAPEGDLQNIFLGLIDSLTPLHLRLLKHFESQAPVRFASAQEWMKMDVCPQAAKELLDRGLIGTPAHLVPNRDRLIIGENGRYTFTAGLSMLGKQFLAFISTPPGLT